MVGCISVTNSFQIYLCIAKGKGVVFRIVRYGFCNFVHGIGNPVILVLRIIRCNKMVYSADCGIQPFLFSGQTV